MPTSFLCGIHLRAIVPKDEAARRLGGCLDVLRAHGLEPMSFAEAAWRNATPRIFGGTTLINREFASRIGDVLWGAGFMIVPAPSADATIITMTTPATPLGGNADAWHWLLGLAENLCDAIRADLGLINGFSVSFDEEPVGGTPAGVEVAPGHPPRVLCPWMYWGATRLVEDDLGAGLRSLAPAAARSSPSVGGGWVLQAHEDYSGDAPTKLQLAYAKTWHLPKPQWLGIP